MFPNLWCSGGQFAVATSIPTVLPFQLHSVKFSCDVDLPTKAGSGADRSVLGRVLGGLLDQALGGGTPGSDLIYDMTGYGNTKSVCVGGGAGAGFGGSVSGCLGVMRTDGGFDLAWIGSDSVDVTSPGWGVSLTTETSNADSWDQVRGSGLGIDGSVAIFTGGYSQAVNTYSDCREDGTSLLVLSVVRNSNGDPVGSFSFGVTTPGLDVGGSLSCSRVH
ncbi:hypothetical protein [Streptomyces cellostaticus]|uniref:hypothetical protein n=1 Tax=Streptomyces TaxID=1883 RepID=UPI0020271247|nr:hypothetical protein [Streptomyces cellostaticus]